MTPSVPPRPVEGGPQHQGIRQTVRVPDQPPPDQPDQPPPAGDEDASGDWRVEVGRFRAGLDRFVFPLGVHVGWPAAERVSLEVPWPVPREYDAGLRFDLLDALVDAWAGEHPGQTAWAWLTRPGVGELHDVDQEWHAAAVRAFGAHEVGLQGFRVVTRNAWLDVVTGEQRRWKRLRL